MWTSNFKCLRMSTTWNLRHCYPRFIQLDLHSTASTSASKILNLTSTNEPKPNALVTWTCNCALQTLKTFDLSTCSIWICLLLNDLLRTMIPAYDDLYDEVFLRTAVINIRYINNFVALCFTTPSRLLEIWYAKELVTVLQSLSSPTGRDTDTMELSRRLNDPKTVLMICSKPVWPIPSNRTLIYSQSNQPSQLWVRTSARSFVVKAETSDKFGRTKFSDFSLKSLPCKCLISCIDGFEFYHSTLEDCITVNNYYSVLDRCLIGFVMIVPKVCLMKTLRSTGR